MPNPTTPPRFSELGRSGTRMLVAMPVTLTGKTAPDKPFTEKTRTVVINSTGAKVLSEQAIAVGSKMTMSIVNSNRSMEVTAVWIGDRRGKQLEVGVDFDTPDPNFWGVLFPEETPQAQPEKSIAKPVASVSAALPAAKALAASAATPSKSVKNSPQVTSPITPAFSPALPPTPTTPVPSGSSAACPSPAPMATGALAPPVVQEGTVIPIRRPQIQISEEGLKSLGGDVLLSTVQNLVREAFEQVLQQVVEDFDRYCMTTINRAKNAAFAEMQVRLKTAVETQLRDMQMEADRVLTTRVENFDQHLAETSTQFCQELAKRLWQAPAA